MYMKFKYVTIPLFAASILLTACDININTGGGDDSDKSSKQSQSKDDKKNNEQDNDNKESNDNENNNSDSNNNASSNNNNNAQNDDNPDNDTSANSNNSKDGVAQNSNDAPYVTRDNVIDIVESYEGDYLDTSEYNYKEPEKKGNGEWGFSFTDKDGNLAGSYIIDKDGYVTKYDENGDPE